ncbi:ABC transporter substrate-binding protein [Bacillus marinisedimentorum]|uniref:ABC transporter substrate-binding protein n=1 Tax=Bacillus marinisedimentorum TaxID=1821260 RepID=UPI000871EC8B|nr:ABC transporter substrate-binding protein [Bacillus marinisedimentorum]
MKKLLAGFVLLVSVLIILAACGSSASEETDGETKTAGAKTDAKESVTVGITQIVEHPSLDAAREGFIEALKDNGYEEGVNLKLDTQLAQGDMSNNQSIAQKFAGDEVDLIFAISTPSAQAALSSTTTIPILFTAITDPVGAELVKSFDSPGGNATGTSDTHPDAIKNTMESIAAFFPDAKKVGIIYNSGEQNSRVNVENAKKAMEGLDLQSVEATVATTSEVKQAAQSLIGRVDVIYIPKDNTVVAGLESVIGIANEKDIPLFVGESDSVKRGGFAGFGFEYHDLGYRTGEMAVDVLNGKAPAEIPVEYPETLDLMINKKAAADQGIEVTDEMKKDAVLVEE